MIQWSKYNTLFHSDKFGYFLYNALSNSFLQFDKPHYLLLTRLQKEQHFSDELIDHEITVLLRKHKIFVTENDEKKALMAKHFQRNTLSYNSSHLDLSICPTLKCNFRCPYCFENTQQSTTVMSSETTEQLISFIKNFNKVNRLTITWYGGEPTLAFNVIEEVTRKIEKLDIKLEQANLITNAYLLEKNKINKLNNLKIKNIQITLDGPEEIHDSRRFLANGDPTFQKIIHNIETLLNSTYKGNCNIRVNLRGGPGCSDRLAA